MNASLHLIFLILFNHVSQEKNLYTTISADEIAAILKKTYNITVGKRQVFNCFKSLSDRGYITRTPRWKRLSAGRIAGISSIIKITVKGAEYLDFWQYRVAKDLIEKIKQTAKNNGRGEA